MTTEKQQNTRRFGAQFLWGLCILVLLCMLCALQVNAVSVVKSGKCGYGKSDDVRWVLYDDETLVIKGEGYMNDYWTDDDNNPPWYDYRDQIKYLVVENGVKDIGVDAMSGCYVLEDFTLAKSVKTIRKCAFAYCNSLKTVTIPKTVKQIDSYPFQGCHSLEQIIVDKNNPNYSSDGNGCLYNKTESFLIQYPPGNQRKKFTVPNTVTGFENGAFADADSLETVVIPNGVTKISWWMFWHCNSLKSLTIPNTVKYIYDSAFSGCPNLKTIKLSKKLKTIGESAFAECTSLRKVNLPNNLKTIEQLAFYSCSSLTEVTIPQSVESIGKGAFRNCKNLTTVVFDNDSCRIGANCFYKTPATLYCPAGSTAASYAKTNRLPYEIVHVHQYGPASVRPATLNADGAIIKTCTICDDKVTVQIPRISSVASADPGCAYTGKPVTPTVTVKDSAGKTLTQGTDYKLTYAKDCIEIGTYAVKVTFKGNYSGSKKVKFKIVPAQVTGLRQRNQKGIIVQWDDVKGADYYEVYFCNPLTGKYDTFVTVEVPPIGSDKEQDVTVKLKVRAVATGNDGKLYKGAFSKVLTAKARG